MKMKKILAVVLVVAVVATICACFVACNKNEKEYNELVLPEYSPYYGNVPAEFKIGLICLHDENSTYDKNFIDAMKEAQQALCLKDSQVIIATGIPEGDECYQKACELADAGCSIIFADSFGHETYMIKAAKKYPNVQFCHATGTMAHTEKLPNFTNAFASIYEGRYLAGIAAGMKLNEMIKAGKFKAEEAKMGYVGAFTYAEVMSGYTSFYLGAKSVCPTVTMEVTFTGSWYDEAAENNAAKKLISNGCKLISQHADSMGAPNACEEAGVPNVSYNGSTLKACPNTFIVSSRINWAPFYMAAIVAKANNYEIPYDVCLGIQQGAVVLTNLGGDAAAEGTVKKILEVRDQLVKGEIEVFDVKKDNYITVTKGENLNTKATVDENGKLIGYMADVDTDEAFTGDTEVVINGAFQESKFRSAPYFDVEIDGITLLDRNYGD